MKGIYGLFCSFTAKLLAWIASRVLGARVSFRFAGFQRLKDVSIHFQKVSLVYSSIVNFSPFETSAAIFRIIINDIYEEAGQGGDCQLSIHVQGPLASLAIGEVRFSFRKQLSALLREYKFQLFISDVEIVMQKNVGTTKRRSKKSRSNRNPTSERRKWIVTANLSKYLKFSITELVLKVAEVRIVFILFMILIFDAYFSVKLFSVCLCERALRFRFQAVFLVSFMILMENALHSPPSPLTLPSTVCRYIPESEIMVSRFLNCPWRSRTWSWICSNRR